MSIRNIAIVAHVDHGKTTLVDAMFRFAGTVRANQQLRERALDSDAQERERGITILAKNTAINYAGVRINIVDTPGHADFGGQVERTLSLADAVLLLVDAFEGPMPQTRFVLRKALERGLRVLVMVNKIDRVDARPDDVLTEVFDLFVELGAGEEQLDFPVIFGSGRAGYAAAQPEAPRTDLAPLFEMILTEVPVPLNDSEAAVRFQATTLEHDDFVGRIAIGRVERGKLEAGARLRLCHPDRKSSPLVSVKGLFRHAGLERIAVESVSAGDVAVVAGIDDLSIGDTLCDPEHVEPLPAITIDEPTITMEFLVNDSPFAGQEGRYVTSRHLLDRLERAQIRDVALSVNRGSAGDRFEVRGRGLMHIGVLIENMRREGFEFAVGKPRVIIREIDGRAHEPYERATVEVPADHAGRIIEYLGRRRGELLNMDTRGNTTRLEFSLPARSLIGARTSLLSLSRGEAILSHVFDAWKTDGGRIPRRSTGVLVSDRAGSAVAHALDSLSDRGIFFVGPGVEVYEGMIVGSNGKLDDLPVNACRTKKLTNIRSSTKDIAVQLTPPREMSLEEYLEYIEDDELLEVTPRDLRLRKRVLGADQRKKLARAARG
ncbi:MAG: translational GTPase TypA [Planctomycetes bacterium]|nr:translational GTPase TypA [Planctomycetota bacterium]MDP6408219.1 translational GTPase TypA [Planctomycetota bacterium]